MSTPTKFIEDAYGQTLYELLDFSLDLPCDFIEEDNPIMVKDDSSILDSGKEEESEVLQFDEQGIPNGEGKEYTKARRVIIGDFYHHWNELHPEKRVHNQALDEDILIRGISLVEAKEHAAKRYRSTLAVLRQEEVLAKARPVRRVPVKKDNSNQSTFDYMLIMTCELEDIGTIKLTVGVRDKKDPLERIQYGVKALEPDEELIHPKDEKPKKKRKAHR